MIRIRFRPSRHDGGGMKIRAFAKTLTSRLLAVCCVTESPIQLLAFVSDFCVSELIMRQARNAVQKSGGDQTGGRRKGDLCRGNHHPDWSAFWMPSGCLLDAFWMPVGCLLDACWMDGRMRHETTPTVALTAIHATVVLPLSPSLPLPLSLSLPPSLETFFLSGVLSKILTGGGGRGSGGRPGLPGVSCPKKALRVPVSYISSRKPI